VKKKGKKKLKKEGFFFLYYLDYLVVKNKYNS